MKLKSLPFVSMAILLTALQFVACKVVEKNRPAHYSASFDWQGHRGCRGILPENSVEAFLHALEYPAVTTLELDLAVSKDKQLIVSHEPWFNPAICRLPNGDSIPRIAAERHLIYEKTVAEIRQYDCGSAGNPRFKDQKPFKTHKPTLREVVAAVRAKYPDKAIRWNIEIKSEPAYDGVKTPPIEEFVALVVQELRALNLVQSANVQSFDIRPLQILHRTAPDIELAYLIENADVLEKNVEKLGFVPQIYSPYYILVSSDLVDKCHQRGMKLIPWTVNDVTAMRRLIRLGVDGIITDYPNKIAEVGNRMQ
jgi:glycerophosphoryl diester phosphodiesterase